MSALGNLFSDIAGAIREKTGETGTMKPAEFPERILGIETGGGGAGGGSLPAGIYWELSPLTAPNEYGHTFYKLNGELYAGALPYDMGGNDVIFYKYTDGAWTEIIAKTNYGMGSLNQWVEFNGKIHFISNGFDMHKGFDGEKVLRYNSIPTRSELNRMFVHEGKLKYYGYQTGKIYVWDEASDTWEAESSPASAYSYYYYLGELDGVPIFNKSKVLYKYIGGAFVTLVTLPRSPSQAQLIGNCLYYTVIRTNPLPQTLYKYNLDALAETTLGLMPNIAGGIFKWDGQIILSIGNYSATRAYLAMRLVEAE